MANPNCHNADGQILWLRHIHCHPEKELTGCGPEIDEVAGFASNHARREQSGQQISRLNIPNNHFVPVIKVCALRRCRPRLLSRLTHCLVNRTQRPL